MLEVPVTAPIVASCRPGGVVSASDFAEPRKVEFKEGGMILHFEFLAVSSFTARMIELNISGVARVYNTGHDTSLVSGDTWSVAIMLPYE